MEIINKLNFDEKISNGIVVVDFFAEWCGPCKTLLPILEDINSTSNGTYVIHKVDVDSDKDLAVKFGIRSIPTILFFKDGQLVTKKQGSLPKGEILNIINGL